MAQYDPYGRPRQAAAQAVPTGRPPRAWWWLPASERRRRQAQRRAWEEARRRRPKRDNDCCDGCDCLGELADPCLVVLIPLTAVSALRAAVGSLGGRRARGPADPAAPVPRGPLAAGLYGAVHHYRTEISPRRRACCPYTPSCSTYAVQALHRHGALRGARLTAARLLRCRPGTAGGHDPVPHG
ncbi:membrane protein insertion efficiency factor YidD [Kitasatospora sp. NBC_01539]|uniref:membrane protein insertion efficiency factor YidD n=1 Tax=Kitasatospora sp. NBC_01539 TaxID=2903577 RepID=UPI0038601FE1